ncbi:hypothetical protein C6P44_003362, partial [Monosporozyma unispora]
MSNNIEVSFEKKFTWLSLFGIAFSLSCSWVGISSTLAVGLSSGGPLLIIYGLIIVLFFSLMCAFSLGQFAYLMPDSCGVSYWTYKLMDKDSAKQDKQMIYSRDPTAKQSCDVTVASVQSHSTKSKIHVSTAMFVAMLNYFGAMFTSAIGLINPMWGFVGIDSASHMVDEIGGFQSRTLVPKVMKILWATGRMFGDSYNVGSFHYNVMKKFGVLTPNFKSPLISHLVSQFGVLVIGCIFIGSDTAFNAIITSCITLLMLSYAVPSFIFLCFTDRKLFVDSIIDEEGLDKSQSPNFSIIPHICCIAWAIFCLVFLSFPYSLPVAASNMNYVSAVYG